MGARVRLRRPAPGSRKASLSMSPETRSPDRLVAQNRRASHDYFILETVEAGVVLKGTEVKSLRQGKASLAEAYASVDGDEVFVHQMHIPPYEPGNRWNQDPIRRRKLLLHRAEIVKLKRAVEQKGLTVIPLKLYFSRGYAKLLLGVAKGKKVYDKRHAIAERDSRREIERARRGGERGR
jgi:SsrA-binding protein